MFRLPLYGTRVLDLSTGWAGPYAARLLADMGAEAIKVEAPGRPDPLRSRTAQPPTEERPWNKAPSFNRVNRNKYGLSLDLAKPQGRELFLRLVSLSDVMVESSLSSVVDDGLTFDALRRAKPDIILVSIFGPDEPGSEPMTGVAAAGAAALALWHRRHSGRGQRIQIDRENLIGLSGDHVLGYSMTGREPPRRVGAPAPSVPEVFADPHLRARGFFEPVAHADGDVCEMDGVPWRFSESPAHVRLPAPRFGEHNGYVLRGLLGLSEGEVAALARDGVTADRPDWPERG